MKTCPVCKRRSYDDMEVCYGCLRRFPQQGPGGGHARNGLDGAYGAYKLRWMAEHGLTVEDLVEALAVAAEGLVADGDDGFEPYVAVKDAYGAFLDDCGFNGAIWASMPEWLEERWGELADVPFCEGDDSEMHLMGDHLCWPAGTPREEIWRDFDEAYPEGVHALMFPGEHGKGRRP